MPIASFINSFSRYVLRTPFVPGTVLGTRNITGSKEERDLFLYGFYSSIVTYLVQYPSLVTWELWLYLSCSITFLGSNTMGYCRNAAGFDVYRTRAQMNDFTYYFIYNGSGRSIRMFYLAPFIFSHFHHYHSRPHCLVIVLLQWTSNWNQPCFRFFHTTELYIQLPDLSSYISGIILLLQTSHTEIQGPS